tara:strand:+ start:39 stop:257 length:219 start_codon:yes stop_codon:yes gene_type:complete
VAVNETLTTSSIKQIMPINKPIPDSVISFWKKQFQKIREIIVRPPKKIDKCLLLFFEVFDYRILLINQLATR